MGYKELIEKANLGLHDAAFEVLNPFLTPGMKILDCGAGSGAFALRLKDIGCYVEAIEVDIDSFFPNDITCYKGNLNDDFSSLIDNTFDIITAIEVIEHIENPRHFLRQCYNLLNSNGNVLITTPNVECIPGRLKFLLKGTLRGFEFDTYKDPNLHEAQHITPIFSSLFMRVVTDTGFSIINHVGYPSKNSFLNSRWIFTITSKIVAPFLRGCKYGENHIFLLEKSNF